jgi:hypothetical protein
VPDVRVVERCQQLRFPVKARQSLGVIGKQVGQDLERDIASEFCVAGAIDLL